MSVSRDVSHVNLIWAVIYTTMFAYVNSMGIYGMDAYKVVVEADVSPGMYKFNVVGLPDPAVSESRERVRSAALNSRLYFPTGKIVVNLAPADMKKTGPVYDLPLLTAILAATNQLDYKLLEKSVFVGELSLNGELHGIDGVLPMILKAQEEGFESIYIPYDNAAEGVAVEGIDVYPVDTVNSLIDHLKGEKKLRSVKNSSCEVKTTGQTLDFSDVKGQTMAKRSIEVAASGGHNILMIGAPGSGKSMLAKRIPTILPDMTYEESIETTKIYSIAGMMEPGVPLIRTRPFRAPHHTMSPASLSGGGAIPHPGELSLAHNGVLFLDELPEFQRNALEILRQPMENGQITISRVMGSVTYPCSVMVVAAMNPCPCGFYGNAKRSCVCSDKAVAKYMSKLSGPLLDRIDIQIEVPSVEFETMSSTSRGESSAVIRERVNRARKIQQERFAGAGISCNAFMTEPMVQQYCTMTGEAKNTLKNAFEILGLSARGHDKILKIARTIADMEQSETICEAHISEAVCYRSLDKKYWGGFRP